MDRWRLSTDWLLNEKVAEKVEVKHVFILEGLHFIGPRGWLLLTHSTDRLTTRLTRLQQKSRSARASVAVKFLKNNEAYRQVRARTWQILTGTNSDRCCTLPPAFARNSTKDKDRHQSTDSSLPTYFTCFIHDHCCYWTNHSYCTSLHIALKHWLL